MNLFERLWRMLPDKCEICKGRKGGVRGNENVVHGKLMCDYCSMIASNEQPLNHWMLKQEDDE